MSANEPIIRVEHISKSFGGVQALKDVQFDIYAGEVHALLGENGAGKSTLIKIITGVHQADSGDIFVNGESVHFATTRDAQQRGIAAIYQEPSLFPDLDIAENIFVGRQPTRGRRVDWKTMYAEAGDLLSRLGVRLNPRTMARELSVAEQQMVEIAWALSVDAKVLIMDEPTSSLTHGLTSCRDARARVSTNSKEGHVLWQRVRRTNRYETPTRSPATATPNSVSIPTTCWSD